MIRLHTDGAVNIKTGKVGIGFVVAGDSLYHQVAQPIVGHYNNHTAEFLAIQYALEWLIDHQLTDQMVFLQTDSKVAADVLQKEFTKNTDYLPYLETILTLKKQFPILEFIWVPEKNNRGADNLAKQALRQ